MAEVSFFDVDAQTLYNRVVDGLQQAIGEPLYPGDERRIFGDAVAAVLIAISNKAEDKAKQRYLRYARGPVLDAFGELTDTPRLAPAYAKCMMQFTLSAVRAVNTVIPEGTRVTPDSVAYFATDKALIIPAGSLSATVTATCMLGGSSYNGIKAGTINTLVDLVAYVDTVTNTDDTSDGDDGEPYDEDGDNRYRERIKLSPAKLSTAGPVNAYEYYAKTADANIIDVSVTSPSACVVKIVPLMKGGQIPDESTLSDIETILSADDVRPMTDQVNVVAPTAVEYDIEIKYYCTDDAEADVVEAVEGAGGAVDHFVDWQSEKLGRDINPDMLRRYVLRPDWAENLTGALRVDVTKPAFTELSADKVAKFSGKLTITHEVVSE